MMTDPGQRPIIVRGTQISPIDDRQRHREKIARITLDSMVQFVGLLDAHGTVLEINKVALDAVGINLSDVEGQPFWTTFWWQVSEEVNSGLRDAIRRASRGEFVRWDAEIFGRAGGKETIIIDASLMPVKEDDGSVVFICAEGRDITEKKAQEREIARQREELAQLDKLKTQFFTNISHEFRTPLTLMMGPLEDAVAEPDGLSDANRDRLELAQRNSQRLLKLVNTLLDFSRIEAGRIEASFEPTDLAAVTIELSSNFRSAIERAGMHLIVDCSPLLEPVYVDREMWEKIVLNLLSNAFKFTFEGQIEVSLRQLGRNVQLTIRDTGIGIPAEEVNRVFERFHRVKGAQGRSYEGSGIGLALVQELVKLHGGTVGVESEEGHGTTFAVTVPFGKNHLPADRIEAARILESTGLRSETFVAEASRWMRSKRQVSAVLSDSEFHNTNNQNVSAATVSALRPAGHRILIADDNADMCDYTRRLLSHYQTRVVADGISALRLAREWMPDLILSDVMMPGLDGFGLLHELRADPRTCDMAVILLSARSGEESRIEGMQAGANDYMVKPFSGRELLARVQAHLQLVSLRRESQATIRQSELLHRMLANLAEATQPLVGSAEIMAASARILAEHLGADRCAYAEVENESVYIITGDYRNEVKSIVGRWSIEAFGTEHLKLMRAGAPHVVSDVNTDSRIGPSDLLAYQATDIAAVICVPLLKNGTLTAAMAVHQRIPRHWTQSEVQLVNAVVARCWESLERARVDRELRDADRRKDEFIALLAHELRNPLAPIRNGLQIMHLASGNPTLLTKAREMMDRQLSHMVRLIDDLLDISRINRNKMELRLSRVALSDILASAVETVRPMIDEAGHELSVTLPAIPIYLNADLMRLAQVFSNLLTNSAKYTPTKGRIWLTAERSEGQASVSVRDTGIGIPPESIRSIFDMFSQVDRSIERSTGGLGIGLALVKGLVDMHGGTVTAVSQGEGAGSTFSVVLPVLREPVPLQKAPTDSAPSCTGPSLRILVVDDNRDGVESLAIMLRVMRHEVETAIDGIDALDKADQFRPDVILMDVGMPRLNGFDATRKLREQEWSKSIKIIALTGWGQEGDRERSRDAGCDGHLVKPLNPTELERALRE